jgi:hypothetical protein
MIPPPAAPKVALRESARRWRCVSRFAKVAACGRRWRCDAPDAVPRRRSSAALPAGLPDPATSCACTTLAMRAGAQRARRPAPAGADRPAARPAGDAARAALGARPDRAALRRAGLHGEAAAPAAPGAAVAPLLECGFSPALVRKLVEGLPAEATRPTGPPACCSATCSPANRRPLEDVGGVFALIGPTGVGKTTSTAKLAAAFAARHGAGNLGLITLDAYRVAAHEQLRAYGRILGVPVHTAHDRASLDDLLDLLSGKKHGADRHRRHGPARHPHQGTAGHAEPPLGQPAAGGQRRQRRARPSRTCCRPTAPAPAAAWSCPRSTRP